MKMLILVTSINYCWKLSVCYFVFVVILISTLTNRPLHMTSHETVRKINWSTPGQIKNYEHRIHKYILFTTKLHHITIVKLNLFKHFSYFVMLSSEFSFVSIQFVNYSNYLQPKKMFSDTSISLQISIYFVRFTVNGAVYLFPIVIHHFSYLTLADFQ